MFSDNTHRDIFLNAKGIQNAFNGQYTRFEETMAKAAVIDTTAKLGYSFDVQIQQPELKGAVTHTIEALKTQTQVIKEVIEALEVTTGDLEGDTDEFGG